jgi:hypothetical protein
MVTDDARAVSIDQLVERAVAAVNRGNAAGLALSAATSSGSRSCVVTPASSRTR